MADDGSGTLLPGIIAWIVGAVLALLVVYVGVHQLEPTVRQSDASLIVYGHR